MKLISRTYKSFLIACMLLLISSFSQAQLTDHYYPRKTHSSLSKDLINELESQFDEESSAMISNKRVRQINLHRKMVFLGKVFDGSFIQDDSLETYVNHVLNKIVSSNALRSFPRRVLIMKSPHVNAVCYGQGIYAVTISLLGRIENENQLAFILAHELAHDELGHIRTRIIQEADLDLEEKAREQTIKIISGKIVHTEIEEFRNLLYDVSRYSRKNEMRADSMAFALLTKANYNGSQAFSALNVLQAAQSPKREIDAELFLPFHSNNFPFQDYWLNSRLSVFSKKYYGTFLYSTDSVESHPAIEIRKEALCPYLTNESQGKGDQSEEFVNAVTEIAEFETVESAYKNREYDLSMYYALQLFKRYPENAYLISRIGKMMIDLYEAKNLNQFELYVAKYTPNYSDELKLINSFLYNLSVAELGEVAFHFLHNNSKPKVHKPHCYLLWKASAITSREDIKDNLKESFKEKFGASINSYSYK